MINVVKDNSKKIIKEKKSVKLTKEELSTYNLCSINGCSEPNSKI